jgi:hypothetical protein
VERRKLRKKRKTGINTSRGNRKKNIIKENRRNEGKNFLWKS